MSVLRRHGGPALMFAALAMAWSYPLVRRIATDLPGEGLGDNATFLWNFWWMRQVLAQPGAHVFFTQYLFAPVGVDLTLHTHTAFPAFLGATALGGVTPLAAQNIVVLAALWLNGFAAYLLAVDRTNDRAAGMIAGMIFAGSPYLSLHLLGHFNLIHAWAIPLFGLCLLRTLESRPPSRWPQRLASVLGGTVLVLVAYTDYYYLVYCVVLAALVIFWTLVPVTVATGKRPLATWIRMTLAILALLDVVLIIVIATTGGFTWHLGEALVSANTITNPLMVLWMLGILWLWLQYRPRIRRVPAHEDSASLVARVLPMSLVAAVGLAPLVMHGAAMWRRGDYVAAPHSWRSGPGGIDLATFVLGNPMSALTGSWTSGVYTRLGVDRIEKTGWVGLVPMVLVLWMVARHRADREVRRWLAIGAGFLIWALGPWLRVADLNLGLPLPQNLFGFVPILSNARMPGRAMVVVMLAVAMLAAVAVTRFDARKRTVWLSLAAALLVADFLPAPFPTVAPRPVLANVSALAAQGPGAVCPLPLGYRDGYGEVGRFNSQTLLDQVTHGHPIVGGFVGRLPPSVRRAYDETPVLRSLLQLSKGEAANAEDLKLTMAESARELLSRNIRFIEFIPLNGRGVSHELAVYVQQKLPLRLLSTDPSGQLYEITPTAGP